MVPVVLDLRYKHLIYLKRDLPEKEEKFSIWVEIMGFGVRLYLGLEPILLPSSWVAGAEAELNYLLIVGSKIHQKSNTKFNK